MEVIIRQVFKKVIKPLSVINLEEIDKAIRENFHALVDAYKKQMGAKACYEDFADFFYNMHLYFLKESAFLFKRQGEAIDVGEYEKMLKSILEDFNTDLPECDKAKRKISYEKLEGARRNIANMKAVRELRSAFRASKVEVGLLKEEHARILSYFYMAMYLYDSFARGDEYFEMEDFLSYLSYEFAELFIEYDTLWIVQGEEDMEVLEEIKDGLEFANYVLRFLKLNKARFDILKREILCSVEKSHDKKPL